MLGLVSYPFIVEPLFTLETQLATWSWGFLIFVTLSALGSLISLRGVSEVVPIEDEKSEEKKRTRRDGARQKNGLRYVWSLWLALSTAAVVMLLAVTNQVTQEVAVIPFLCVLPLSLYLLSLIICFENEKYYSRKVFVPLLPVAAIAIAILLAETPGDVDILHQISVYSAALFVICMVCHGELVHLKPSPERLTGFYLRVAIGGASGGILVGLVAPLIFDGFLEMHYGVIATFALILVALYVNVKSGLHQGRPIWLWGLLLTSFVIPSSMMLENLQPHSGVRETRRNFYGVFWIYEERTGGSENYYDAMVSAGTQHGHQYIAPERQCRPTTYYGEESGVGLALRYFSGEGDFRVGAVGLGVGTIAAYASENSYIRFYEINADVIEVAQEQFSFLECASQVDVILGDARLVLEQEGSQKFDLFVLDAFRGDAIPLHLLTLEAFEIYMRHLKPDGVIIVLISNAHLNYEPVIAGLAEHLHLETMLVEAAGADGKSRFSNDWIALTNNRQLLGILAANGGVPLELPIGEQARFWTDNFSNLYQILK